MSARRLISLVCVLVLVVTTSACGARKKVEEKVAKVAEKAVEKVVGKAITDAAQDETREAERDGATSNTPTPKPRRAPTETKPVADAQPERAYVPPETFGQPDMLDSYRLHVKVSTTIDPDTTASDEPQDSEMEYWIEVVREPPASRMVTSVYGGGDEGTFETIQIGDIVYINPTGEMWMVVTQEAGTAGAAEVMALGRGYQFSELPDCKDMGTETIGGLETRRYRCDETTPQWKASVFAPEILGGQMEAWVSTDYDLVVKSTSDYRVKTEEGEIRELHMTMEFTDINAPITIEAPADAPKPGLPDDIPLIDGADNMQVVTPMVTFEVAKRAQDVSDWYVAAMKDHGWSLAEGESMLPMMHTYAKGDRQANMIIAEAEGKTSVTVIVAEP